MILIELLIYINKQQNEINMLSVHLERYKMHSVDNAFCIMQCYKSIYLHTYIKSRVFLIRVGIDYIYLHASKL